MPHDRHFYAALAHLVEMEAADSLTYCLDEACALKRAALASPHDGVPILVLDENDTIFAANQSAACLFNLHQAELVGRCVFDLAPPHVGQFYRRVCAMARRTNSAIRLLDSMSDRWYEVSIEPLNTTIPGGVMCRIFDVTNAVAFDIAFGGEVRFKTMVPVPVLVQ